MWTPLSYISIFSNLWKTSDSNREPSQCKCDALRNWANLPYFLHGARELDPEWYYYSRKFWRLLHYQQCLHRIFKTNLKPAAWIAQTLINKHRYQHSFINLIVIDIRGSTVELRRRIRDGCQNCADVADFADLRLTSRPIHHINDSVFRRCAMDCVFQAADTEFNRVTVSLHRFPFASWFYQGTIKLYSSFWIIWVNGRLRSDSIRVTARQATITIHPPYYKSAGHTGVGPVWIIAWQASVLAVRPISQFYFFSFSKIAATFWP